MAAAIPDDVVKVAESGIRGGDDAKRLADAGYDAVLVGETLVTVGRPGGDARRPARPLTATAFPGHAGDRWPDPIPLGGAGRQYRDASMFVKICGITSEDDALLAVAMGADAVGFVFAPSPRQVPVQQVYDITRRLPPEIMTVGVFRDEHPKRVVEIVHRSGVKGAQLHGNESAEVVAEVAKAVRFLVKAYPAGSPLIAAVGLAGHRHDPDRRPVTRLRPPLRLVARRRAPRRGADDPRRRV